MYPSSPRIAFVCLLAAVPTLAQTTKTINARPMSAPNFHQGKLPIKLSESHISFDESLQISAHIKEVPASLANQKSSVNDKSFSYKLHFESGFDDNDKSLSQLSFVDANQKRRAAHVEDVAKVQLYDGRTTLFDSDGSPLPVASAAGATQENLIGGLQSTKLGSPLKGVVVSDIEAFAKRRSGQVTYTDSSNAIVTILSVKKRTSNSKLSFLKSGQVWILQRQDISVDSGDRTISKTVIFSNVQWNENLDGEARRRAAFVKANLANPNALLTPVMPDFRQSAYALALKQQQDAKKAANHGLLLGHVQRASLSADTNFQSMAGAAGSNVAFLHGLASSGATWDRMIPWLTSDFPFSSTIAPSDGNGGVESLVTWSQEVDNDLSSAGNNFLVIGHSAGGLIGRSVAAADPTLVRGFISVDTPNQGSIALSNGFYYAQQLAEYAVGIATTDACEAADYGTCAALGGTLGYVAVVGLDSWVGLNYGAALDLSYHSAYTQLLNAVPQTVPHAFVASESDPRWLEYRLGADAFSYPDDALGGRNVALLAESAYDGLGVASLIWFEYAQDAYDNGDDDNGDYYSELSSIADDGQYWMDWLDNNFYNFVNIDNASGDQDSGGDGLVQISSQINPDPSAPGIIIYGGDSHVGATKSSYVRTALDQLLTLQMFTPPATAPCTYNVQPLQSDTGYTGGFVEFSVTTQSYCSWTANSNSSWLSPSLFGSGGQGSGTAEFFGSANISSYPIQGSLTIAGQDVPVPQDGKPSGIGVGIMSVSVCAPQDNCVVNGTSNSLSATVNGITATGNCAPFLAICLGNLGETSDVASSFPATFVIDQSLSRLILFSNTTADAYDSFSGSSVNTPNLLMNVSTSGPTLVP